MLDNFNNNPASFPSGQQRSQMYMAQQELTPQQVQKIKYAQELESQIRQKEMEKESNVIKEKILEMRMLAGRQEGDWFGRQGAGAPIRDSDGMILSNRKNRFNPNYQSYNVIGGGRHAPFLNYSNIRPTQTSNLRLPVAQNVLAGNSNFQPPQQTAYGPNMTTSMYQAPNINNQPDYNPALAVSTFQDNIGAAGIGAGPMENGLTFDQIQKREQAISLQRDLKFQMDERKRKKDEEKMREKKEAELEELRVRKEREESEIRLLKDFGNLDLESRNLQETNFDSDALKAKKRRLRMQLQNSQPPPQEQKREVGKRPRTPLEEAEEARRRAEEDQRRRYFDDKMMKELPNEIFKNVQSVMDVELMKMKNELNFQQNVLGEQLLNLKGQLLVSNDLRNQSEDEIKRLKNEIQKTQVIDEIRQRELYAALVLKSKKPEIYHTITHKLEDPEQIDFKFPVRPRPYYRYDDPYILDNEIKNQDIHEIITSQTQMIPLSHDYAKNKKFNEYTIQERMINRTDRPGSSGALEFGTNAKGNPVEKYTKKFGSYGLKLDPEEIPNIPDDIANLQGIYEPQMNYDDARDVVNTYKKNIYRLDLLDSGRVNPIFENDLEKLDKDLFKTISQRDFSKSATFGDTAVTGETTTYHRVIDPLIDKLNNPQNYRSSWDMC